MATRSVRESLLNDLASEYWDLVDDGKSLKEAFQELVDESDLSWDEIERFGNIVGYRPWRTAL